MSSSSTPTLQDEDDPVEHTYSVFIKPPLPANRRLVVLQHPNTQSDNPHDLRSPPVAGLRLKPATGMLEADVPVDYNVAYDRHKGMVWGSALQKSAAAKTSLGLAGGFGVGGAPARTRATRGQAAADDDNVEGGDWNEAVRRDRVLRMQTLGGLSAEPKDARYLVAVFQGKNVHLTPVSSLAHIRPQLHHIDASAEQERIGRASAAPASGSGGGGQQKDGGGGGSAPTARAIHMTIKSVGDGGEAAAETMADRLRGVQMEPWRRLEYADEETDDAWLTYQQSLLLRTEEEAAAAAAAAEVQVGADESKGKKPEGEDDEEEEGERAVAGVEDEVDDAAGAPDLHERVYGLGTEWGEDELLRAVSGIKAEDKKPGEEAVTEPTGAGGKGGGKGAAKKEPAVKAESGAAAGAEAGGAKRAARPRRTAAAATTAAAPAATAARRGGRTRTTAMEID